MKPIVSSEAIQLDEFNTYYGLAINETVPQHQYYLLVAANRHWSHTGTVEGSKHKSHMIKVPQTISVPCSQTEARFTVWQWFTCFWSLVCCELDTGQGVDTNAVNWSSPSLLCMQFA